MTAITKNNRIYSLDFLRALGCIGVVLNHATSLSEPTFINYIPPFRVELFFTISGLLAYLAFKPHTNAFAFAKRRLLRLVPLYWLATFLAIILYYFHTGSLIDYQHIISSILFIRQPENQLAPILYPAWTLNFEIAFIAIISISYLINKKYTVLTASIIIISISLLRYKLDVYYFDYYINQRFTSFVFGILVGHLISTKQYVPSHIALPASAIFLIIIIFNGGNG